MAVLYRAVHDFEGQASDELTFRSGDKIELLSKISAEWYKGRLK